MEKKSEENKSRCDCRHCRTNDFVGAAITQLGLLAREEFADLSPLDHLLALIKTFALVEAGMEFVLKTATSDTAEECERRAEKWGEILKDTMLQVRVDKNCAADRGDLPLR